MAHRRASKHTRPARPLSSGHASIETRADGAWIVRSVPGARALKAYVCPGCQQTIGLGIPHVVAWPHEPSLLESSPVAARRHWHTGCWKAKR